MPSCKLLGQSGGYGAQYASGGNQIFSRGISVGSPNNLPNFSTQLFDERSALICDGEVVVMIVQLDQGRVGQRSNGCLDSRLVQLCNAGNVSDEFRPVDGCICGKGEVQCDPLFFVERGFRQHAAKDCRMGFLGLTDDRWVESDGVVDAGHVWLLHFQA